MLAAAVGPNLTKLLHDQLDLMLACGLSEPLRHALVAIARYIPPLLKTIQGKECSPSHCLAFLILFRPSS
jgi:FKBP12-rapamycin complex-associated protein